MARAMPALRAEVLYYAAREALRNAAQHGRPDEGRPLHLRLGVSGREGFQITVEDNGPGMDGAPVSPAGAGQGLALHSTMMAVVGGTLSVENVRVGGSGTRVVLRLPPGSG
jgi:signal transduction histidine kinase